MKEQLIQRLDETNSQLQALQEDYTKLQKIIKEVETKIIFTNGKIAEITEILESIDSINSEKK